MKEEKDKKIIELEEKIAELENNWKRALADYRNLQKRTEEEKESLVSFISSIIFKRILPVLDNLELVQKHINDTGLDMITKEFRQILADEGVTEMEALGKEFDAQTMDAVETVEGEPDRVIEVINKGYLLKNKLLRPPRVKVGSQERKG